MFYTYKIKGRAETRTRNAGFKVQSDNHVTTRPSTTIEEQAGGLLSEQWRRQTTLAAAAADAAQCTALHTTDPRSLWQSSSSVVVYI